jgi:membrane protein required for colicin V production
MQALDWIFSAVLVFSMVVGAWRGLVFEVLSLIGWIAAFFFAQWFAMDAGQLLPMSGTTDAIRYAAGFILVFVAVVFLSALVAFLVKKLVAAVGLSPADRLLGAAFGLVRGALMLLAITVVVGMTPLHTAVWWQEATGPRVANVVLHELRPLLPADFVKYLP